MIFDREDVEVLKRVMMRKGVETAAVSFNQNLTEAQRVMVADELVRDIARCQLMICIGTNDFSDIVRQLESFDEDLSALPPTIYAAYMESMTPTEKDDEGQYIWMLTALISNTYLIRKGLELTHILSTADHVLKPHEVRMIISVRDELREIAVRCDALDDSGIGPKEYAEAVGQVVFQIDTCLEGIETCRNAVVLVLEGFYMLVSQISADEQLFVER